MLCTSVSGTEDINAVFHQCSSDWTLSITGAQLSSCSDLCSAAHHTDTKAGDFQPPWGALGFWCDMQLDKGLSRTCCLSRSHCPPSTMGLQPMLSSKLSREQEPSQAKIPWQDKPLTSPWWTVRLPELSCVVENSLSLIGFLYTSPSSAVFYLADILLRKRNQWLRLISGHCLPFARLPFNFRIFSLKN